MEGARDCVCGHVCVLCVCVCVCVCAHMIIPEGSLIPGGSPGTPPALPYRGTEINIRYRIFINFSAIKRNTRTSKFPN